MMLPYFPVTANQLRIRSNFARRQEQRDWFKYVRGGRVYLCKYTAGCSYIRSGGFPRKSRKEGSKARLDRFRAKEAISCVS